jgi:CRP-like cAMP-binding protein/Fe-S-cluster-containing hydrogenase component 2
MTAAAPPPASKAIAEVQLAHGEPITVDQLIAYKPFAEVPKASLEKYPGAVVLRKFKKGDIICREGEYGSTAFYILKGKVQIYLATPMAHLKSKADTMAAKRGWFGKFKTFLAGSKEDPRESARTGRMIPIDAPVDLELHRPIAEMGEGDLFGEMTCLNFYPRSATVQATEDCEMLEMLRNVLTLLQKRSKVFKEMLDKGYKQRSVKTHLRSLPLFSDLSDEKISEVAEKVELVSCEPGQVIVKQGDPADAAYLIRLGFVKVSQAFPGGELVLRYLHRGDFFGAAGILGSGVRSATCTAVDHVEVVKIKKEDIVALMKSSPRVRLEMHMDLARTKAKADAEQMIAPSLPLDDMLESGLMQAQSLLLIDLESCTRCDDCVRGCASTHDGVTRLVRDGVRFDKYLVATSCRSCADPLCLVGCPVGAIHRKDSLEIVIEDWCIGCSLCSKQCPYGNINMHPIEGAEVPIDFKGAGEAKGAAPKQAKVQMKAVTCDLCGGDGEPSCVYACPHGAALRVDPKDFFTQRKAGP